MVDLVYLRLKLPPAPLVYFMVSGSKMKVGYTRNLLTRISHLNSGSGEPVDCLGFIPGGRELEKTIHRALRPWRAHGEWFHLNESIYAYAQRMIRAGGVFL